MRSSEYNIDMIKLGIFTGLKNFPVKMIVVFLEDYLIQLAQAYLQIQTISSKNSSSMTSNKYLITALFLLDTVVAPIMEEFMVRDLVQNAAKNSYRTIFPKLTKEECVYTASITNSIIFGVIHSSKIDKIYSSMTYNRINQKYDGNITPSIVAHMTSNTIGTFLNVLLRRSDIIVGLRILGSMLIMYELYVRFKKQKTEPVTQLTSAHAIALGHKNYADVRDRYNKEQFTLFASARAIAVDHDSDHHERELSSINILKRCQTCITIN